MFLKLLVSLTNSTRHDYLRPRGMTNPHPQVILEIGIRF